MNGFRLSTSNCLDWTTKEASRELIANLNDAIIEASGSVPIYVHEVSPEVSPDIHYCVARVNNIPYGSIGWKKSSAVFELINRGVSITIANLTDIGTSKKRGTSAVGQFGEGLKDALGPFIRSGCTITFQTPSFTKSFVSQVNTNNPDDDVMVMVDSVPTSPLPSWVDSNEWTRVVVSNIKEHDQVAWDSFLFLIPRGRDSIPVYSTRREPIVLRGESRIVQKVFVQGVLVCSRDDLPFGLGMGRSIKMNRDRSTLKETSAELLLKAVSYANDRFNPNFIQFMFECMNKQDPEPVFEQFARLCKVNMKNSQSFCQSLYDHGLQQGKTFYGCQTWGSVPPERRKLVALHPRKRVVNVSACLFKIFWSFQGAKLENFYVDILRQLITKKVSESVLSRLEQKKLYDLKSFLSGLLNNPSISVILVDSSEAFSHKIHGYDRFPCLWDNVSSRLILDRKLLNNKNVHARIKEDIKRETERCKPGLVSAPCPPCNTDAHCACLQSTVILQVQLSHNISKAHCTRFMLHWSKAHHEAVRREELAGELSPDELDDEPGQETDDEDDKDDSEIHPLDLSNNVHVVPPPSYSLRNDSVEEEVKKPRDGEMKDQDDASPFDETLLSDQELVDHLQRLLLEQSKRFMNTRQKCVQVQAENGALLEEKRLMIQETEEEEKRLSGRKRRLLGVSE
jgi:hypothetical protein